MLGLHFISNRINLFEENRFITPTSLLDYFGKPELGFLADCAGTVITGTLQMQFNSFSLKGASNQVSNTVTSHIFCGLSGVTSSFCVAPVWSAQLCHCCLEAGIWRQPVPWAMKFSPWGTGTGLEMMSCCKGTQSYIGTSGRCSFTPQMTTMQLEPVCAREQLPTSVTLLGKCLIDTVKCPLFCVSHFT